MSQKKYELREVWTTEDKRTFLQVAILINGKDPNWIQPLDQDIESVFDPAKNILFSGGEAIRWVLYENNKPVGRIAAFYNKKLAAKESQPTGGCGFFECVNNQSVADRLFDAACRWLKVKGMQAMDGSINFGDRMFWWGVLVEGFSAPLYGMNHNPPYYDTLFERYGFQNYFNQYTYLRSFDPEIQLSDAIIDRAERLDENPDYRFSGVSLKDIKKLAKDFRHVYNSAWAEFNEIDLLSSEQAEKTVRQLKPIVDPELIIFAYYKEEAVGFFIMIPDLNQITRRFKGKFGIRQKLNLLWQLKISKSIDKLSGLVFGVSKEYQGKGIEAGMIRHLEEYTQRRDAQKNVQYKELEMAWIGDFNPLMMRLCEQYVMAKQCRRYVTYRYLFDRNKPFERCPPWRSKERDKNV